LRPRAVVRRPFAGRAHASCPGWSRGYRV
jgi:hypothetical protein